MLSDSDKTADHEMCSSDHGCFHCVRFASIRGLPTAFSGESSASVWRRSDRYRKRFGPTSYEASACYSAEISAVSAATRRRFACVTGAFSPLVPRFAARQNRREQKWRRHGAANIDGHGLYSTFAIQIIRALQSHRCFCPSRGPGCYNENALAVGFCPARADFRELRPADAGLVRWRP
jgi:hypothetical protein